MAKSKIILTFLFDFSLTLINKYKGYDLESKFSFKNKLYYF